jgi:hypothetical protein
MASPPKKETPSTYVASSIDAVGRAVASMMSLLCAERPPDAMTPSRPTLLSVFDDQQLITRLPGTIVRGHRCMQNSMVNAERQRFILV